MAAKGFRKPTAEDREGAVSVIAEVEKFVSGTLSPERLNHVRGVVQTAKALAIRYGADPDKAMLAAWLHDVAREVPDDDLLKLADEFGIIFTDIEVRVPHLWHAPVGTRFARRQFGVTDLDVLAAIRYHTTGRAGMSLLEQIVFLADVIEPGRSFPDAEQLREWSETDMERAVLAALEHIIVRSVERGTLLHPDTVSARNELVSKRNKR